MDLQVGVAIIRLRLRHSQTLKDKRRVTQGLIQKMRNLGVSVTDCGAGENTKLAELGLSFAASSVRQMEDCFEQVGRLLAGDFEVLEFHCDRIDYSNPYAPLFSESILDDRDPDDL
jgi:uncharacterized protein YlxP (DUF503 family)